MVALSSPTWGFFLGDTYDGFMYYLFSIKMVNNFAIILVTSKANQWKGIHMNKNDTLLSEVVRINGDGCINELWYRKQDQSVAALFNVSKYDVFYCFEYNYKEKAYKTYLGAYNYFSKAGYERFEEIPLDDGWNWREILGARYSKKEAAPLLKAEEYANKFAYYIPWLNQYTLRDLRNINVCEVSYTLVSLKGTYTINIEVMCFYSLKANEYYYAAMFENKRDYSREETFEHSSYLINNWQHNFAHLALPDIRSSDNVPSWVKAPVEKLLTAKRSPSAMNWIV